jgi:hypothetical protein
VIRRPSARAGRSFGAYWLGQALPQLFMVPFDFGLHATHQQTAG